MWRLLSRLLLASGSCVTGTGRVEACEAGVVDGDWQGGPLRGLSAGVTVAQVMTAVSRVGDGLPGQAGAQLAEPHEPAAAGSAVPGDFLRSPALQGGLAFLIYLAAWVSTSFRPIVMHASQALLDQKSQDPNFYIWGLRWWPYAIGHGLNPFYTHQIAAPAGHSLA